MEPLTPEQRALAETPPSQLPLVYETDANQPTQDIRLVRAVELRMAGYTYREIAAKLHMSMTTIQQHVAKALAQMTTDTVESHRAIAHTRLEKYTRLVDQILDAAAELNDPNLVMKCVRELKGLNESERDLLGLDAPQKIEAMPVQVVVNGIDLGEV